MAYAVSQSDGTKTCPETHPTPVPEIQMVIKFRIPTTPGKVTLSSGAASTMHADFFNAWGQKTLESLVTRCINHVWPLGSKPADFDQR